MKEKTALVIGHRECYDVKKEAVRKTVIAMAEQGYTVFLLGGMGMFDTLCARVIFELRREGWPLKSYLVIPYLSFKFSDREIYNDVVYPEGFEKYHYKRAIVERNRYMVDASAGALVYVQHSFGGAYQTLTYAKKCKIQLFPLEK